jgi:flagellar basal body-associated protein FliL
MSDAADPKKEEPAGDHAAKKSGGIKALLTKLPVLLGGVMTVEAVILIAVLKMMGGGPADASAESGIPHGDEAAHVEEGGHGKAPADAHGEAPVGTGIDPKKPTEVVIVEFRAPNKRSGRTFLYDVSIYAVVRGKNKPAVEAAIKDRGALIKDRVRTIIAQSDPEKLGGGTEPGLETLRRQVKHQLDDILGEGIVEEVLVPRCIPFRTDF